METVSIICGWVMLFLCISGFFGNLLSVLVYCRKRMLRLSINILIVGLSVVDLCLLSVSLIVFAVPPIIGGHPTVDQTKFVVFSSFYLYPICLMLQTASVFIYALISTERFVAVCHPLKVRALCPAGRAVIFLLLTVVFAVTYNLPRVFEYEIVSHNFTGNSSIQFRTFLVPLLRKDENYVVWYCNVGYGIAHIFFLAPICVLR